MSERRIGKIISVDSFRLIVQLDEDLKGLYKSGFNDIYEIARINSYLIIPVGADRIVAIVTRVKIQDETEIEKNSSFITLPRSQRYLVATMIGTVESGEDYKQGVYNYPILDNPVWFVTKEDLDKIFDTKIEGNINLNEDYYLPIGTSPAFANYNIKINPDMFFGKHAAILGNTGSGKSCTVASIIQSLFKFEFHDKKKIQSANFIIFDTNGEYRKAFIGDDENIYESKELVNAFHINKDGLKVPYWFMNFDDIDYLFEPSPGTQAPIVKRALALAKGQELAITVEELPPSFISLIYSLLNFCDNIDEFWKLDSYDIPKNVSDLGTYKTGKFDKTELIKALNDLQLLKQQLKQYAKPNPKNLSEIKERIKTEIEKYSSTITTSKSLQDANIDFPIWFSFINLVNLFIDEAIQEQESSNNKIREYLSTLKLRLTSYLNDERISSPLLLKSKTKIESALCEFLAFILGDTCKIFIKDSESIFSKYYESQFDNVKNGYLKKEAKSQITIIDMSLLPFEVLETITGLIGRLILEFLSRFEGELRGTYPTVIVLEEAQNYVPEKDRGTRVSIAKKIFERIAREGRKYGLSLIVSSQRPSEISKTVLSQCNSFIIHRLQNPEDQKYVKQLVSAANEDILQQLPILPQQHAVIMGDCVRTPVQVKINKADPKPNSDNPKFIEKWLNPYDKNFPDYKTISKEWEEGGLHN
jgi:hypothetical protein